jgi:tetratricopeptide (TPR) repeat protein
MKFLSVAVTLLALTAPSTADIARDAAVCADDSASPDRVIAACSGVIGAPDVAIDIKFKAYVRRADAYFAGKGDYEHAVADASEAIKLKPESAPAHAIRGGMHLSYNEFPKAIVDFSEAIRLDPSDANFFGSRGYAYAQSGDSEKAIADYSELLRLRPADANAYYDRGGAYEKREDFDKARSDYEQAIRLQRDYAGEFPDSCFGMNDKGERGLKNWPACEPSE